MLSLNPSISRSFLRLTAFFALLLWAGLAIGQTTKNDVAPGLKPESGSTQATKGSEVEPVLPPTLSHVEKQSLAREGEDVIIEKVTPEASEPIPMPETPAGLELGPVPEEQLQERNLPQKD